MEKLTKGQTKQRTRNARCGSFYHHFATPVQVSFKVATQLIKKLAGVEKSSFGTQRVKVACVSV
jgi:hypothetical protein